MVIDPNGRRARVPLYPFPFRMGRGPDNNLILRDSRVSRNHAQIAQVNGRFVLEDLASRHGVWVNGQRVEKSRVLEGLEQIQFGVPDGYQIHFTRGGDELQRLMNKPVVADTSRPAAGQVTTAAGRRIWKSCARFSKWADRCRVPFRRTTC